MERNCASVLLVTVTVLFNLVNGEAIANLTAAGGPCTEIQRDCLDLYVAGCRQDGVYEIDPKQDDSRIRAFCDMTYNGGGWTVILRRIDDSVDFFRNWNEFARGFGDLEGNMWWGLENMYKLTKFDDEEPSELFVELRSFENEYKYAKYSNFYIDDSKDLFKLHLSGYYGTAGDSMTYHSGGKFCAYDLDADTDRKNNCARMYYGAWWFKSCLDSNLNGLYLRGEHSRSDRGIHWKKWKGNRYSYKTIVMKARRQSPLVDPAVVP